MLRRISGAKYFSLPRFKTAQRAFTSVFGRGGSVMSMVPLETESGLTDSRSILKQRDADWISLTIILAVTLGLITLILSAI
jgi:hypothetical protein